MADDAGYSEAFSNRVRAHLAQILDSPTFAGSARLSGFLRYTVIQTLNGKGDEIKEYLIAMEVYERRSGYDPQSDSIVRVEASRLRKKLRDYYEGPGRETDLRIDLPRGAYRPRIVEVTPEPSIPTPETQPLTPGAEPSAAVQATPPSPGPPPSTARTPAFPWKPVLAAAILLAAGIGYWSFHRQPAVDSGSYAVLPLVNMTGQPVEDDFCDGLTEELTARLATSGDLKVLARTTMSSFKGKAVDLSRAGTDLGVAYFLEGSVRRVGQRYRITMQLISARDGYHVWAETFERPATDALNLERALASEVVEQIRSRTLGRAEWRSKGRTPPSGTALDAFLEASALMKQDIRQVSAERGIPPSMEQAVAKLELAVQQKPDFTQAWVYLAHAYELCADYDPARTGEFINKGKAASRRAIEADETSAEGYGSIATLELYRDLDPVRAEASFRRAVDLKPRDPRLMRVYGDVLRILGQPAKAMTEIDRAISMSPDEIRLRTQKAVLLYSQEDWDQALELLKIPLAATPRMEEAHWLKALILQGQGKYAEAEAVLRDILTRRPHDTRALPALGNLLGVMGRRAEAAEVARELEQAIAKGLVREYSVALVYCGMGEKAKALDWLERAFERKDPSTVYLMVEARLRPLQNEPRARRIAEKMGILQPASN
ncbi:MAG: tetratricopeptide repeat protein [Acidobacteriota bacterium]